MRVRARACLRLLVRACVRAFVHVFMCVCVRACVCTFAISCARVRVRVCARARVFASLRARACVRVCHISTFLNFAVLLSQVSPDLLHVWLPVPGLLHSGPDCLRNYCPSLLFPLVC